VILKTFKKENYMIKIIKVEASYFENCDNCGEIYNMPIMYEIKIGNNYRDKICPICFRELCKQIKIIEFEESL
jgi:NAD-dependent dihydropyrimidine dehydrogenase PreA subunit